MAELTELLNRVQAGEAVAREALFAAAYPRLQQLARSRLRHSGPYTVLDTVGLVNESYLRFMQAGELRAADRPAFFAYAARIMHSVIVTVARERQAQKRGSGQRMLTLSTQLREEVSGEEPEVLRVHEALEALEQADARLAQVVQMRYFGGYSEAEIASTLQITERTVQRMWVKAKLMLLAAID